MDKIRQQVDFEVNVRAEHEITKVLNMLHEVHQKLGLNSDTDTELEEMKENYGCTNRFTIQLTIRELITKH